MSLTIEKALKNQSNIRLVFTKLSSPTDMLGYLMARSTASHVLLFAYVAVLELIGIPACWNEDL